MLFCSRGIQVAAVSLSEGGKEGMHTSKTSMFSSKHRPFPAEQTAIAELSPHHPVPYHPVKDELQDEEVQQDTSKMEEVLDRLARFQEDADIKRVYDLSTKVQRIMNLMGFSIR